MRVVSFFSFYPLQQVKGIISPLKRYSFNELFQISGISFLHWKSCVLFPASSPRPPCMRRLVSNLKHWLTMWPPSVLCLQAFAWWTDLMVEHAENFLALYAIDMDAALEIQSPESWDSFPLFQLLNDFLRTDCRFMHSTCAQRHVKFFFTGNTLIPVCYRLSPA